MAVKLMMSKGLISRLVAFEIIAPILSRLDWSESDEDTFSTNNDISNYMKSFTTTINEKDYLTPSAEQAIMMHIMLDLNRLHSVEQQAIADKTKISSYLNLLLEMYAKEPKSNFERLCQSFMKVAALTHDWNFPIRFPSFLLIDDFMKRIAAKPITLHPSDFVRQAMKATSGKDINLFSFIKKYEKACKELKMREDLAHRYLNEGFSGGEKKRNEILQMKMLEPKFAILDEIDSGLDVDALRIVGENVYNMVNENLGVLLITHYERLLDYIKPDYVHVMIGGKIVKTGGRELIEKIDREGYDWVKSELGLELEDEEYDNQKHVILGSCAHAGSNNE